MRDDENRARVPAAAPSRSYRPPPADRDGTDPTTPKPGESEAEAAARVGREGAQDPWGDAEDQPDHDENEVYIQQDETREQ